MLVDEVGAIDGNGGLAATARSVTTSTDGTAVKRKWVRTGHLSGTIDDYAPYRDELDLWLTAHGGFVADTTLRHRAGKVGWGTLLVRVPGDQLEALTSWTESRVEIGSMSIDSLDVTEQWTDLDARLANMERAETRLAGLLEHETENLTDVLAVERELARVRGDIESLQGRLRVLNDQIDLATITLDLSVRTPYAPALQQPLVQAAGQAFTGSLVAMRTLGRALILAMVALSPWLALGVALTGVLLGVGRRIRRVLQRQRLSTGETTSPAR